MVLDSAMRSERDMRITENNQEALWRLDRCETDAEFAAWARSYGRPLLEAKLSPRGLGTLPHS